MNKVISKEVRSPCQTIYSIKKGVDKISTSPVKMSEYITEIYISYPAKEVQLDKFAERISRAIFGYYNTVEEIEDGYVCYGDSDKLNWMCHPVIRVKFKNQRVTASFMTSNVIAENDVKL